MPPRQHSLPRVSENLILSAHLPPQLQPKCHSHSPCGYWSGGGAARTRGLTPWSEQTGSLSHLHPSLLPAAQCSLMSRRRAGLFDKQVILLMRNKWDPRDGRGCAAAGVRAGCAEFIKIISGHMLRAQGPGCRGTSLFSPPPSAPLSTALSLSPAHFQEGPIPRPGWQCPLPPPREAGVGAEGFSWADDAAGGWLGWSVGAGLRVRERVREL